MKKELFIKYFNGSITEEEEKILLLWIEESEENRRIFLNERRLWDLLLLNTSAEAIMEGKPRVVNYMLNKRKLVAEISKVAAIFLLALTIGFFYFNKREHKTNKREHKTQEWNTIEVPVGQRTSIKLSDGTIVWLNAKTKLMFPGQFGEGMREVELDGEAFFDVVHDEKRPFVVRTRQYDIRVLGTKFNVYAYSRSKIFETALASGKVLLDNRKSKRDTELKPNEIAIYNETDGELKIKKRSIAEFFSWKEGIYSFKDQPLRSIIQRLERYYDITIQVQDQSVLDYKFTGKLRFNDPIEVILEVIKKSRAIKYTKRGNIITIYN